MQARGLSHCQWRWIMPMFKSAKTFSASQLTTPSYIPSAVSLPLTPITAPPLPLLFPCWSPLHTRLPVPRSPPWDSHLVVLGRQWREPSCSGLSHHLQAQRRKSREQPARIAAPPTTHLQPDSSAKQQPRAHLQPDGCHCVLALSAGPDPAGVLSRHL